MPEMLWTKLTNPTTHAPSPPRVCVSRVCVLGYVCVCVCVCVRACLWVFRTRRGSFHLTTVKTQQVSVGIVNEMGFDLDVHYQWADDEVKPTHIRT